jgi:hypothetical protein
MAAAILPRRPPGASIVIDNAPPGDEVRAFISNEVDVVAFFQGLKGAGLRVRLDRERDALIIECDPHHCQEVRS